MKRIGFLFLLPFVLSCGSGPQPTAQVDAPPPPEKTLEPAAVSTPEQGARQTEPVFDPGSITREKFESAKMEVQTFIEDLNRIIRARNYNAWIGFLSDSYFTEISSQAFLEEKTEELYKRDQTVASSTGRDPSRVTKRILRTARDYFENVVGPSRSNDHVDDIAFVSDNRVKAYTLDSR
jgi:hypothetical protein